MSAVSNPLLAAALAAIARGWAVVPLHPGTKKPAFHGYSQCPRIGPCTDQHVGWQHRTIRDPEKACWYWESRRGAGCNVGVVTEPSDLVVVDLDVRKPGDPAPFPPWNRHDVHSGEDVFLLLCHEAGQLPPVDTYSVATPSGGLHLYYTAPAGTVLPTTVGSPTQGLGWKIDTRAALPGQVVAAGSVVDGRRYRVVFDVDPMPLPHWLARKLTPQPAPPRPVGPVRVTHRSAFVDAAVRATVARIKKTRVNRNAALWGGAKSLGELVAGGQLSEHDHAQALMEAAAPHIGVGAYSARQAAATIASGLRSGMRHPRTVSP